MTDEPEDCAKKARRTPSVLAVPAFRRGAGKQHVRMAEIFAQIYQSRDRLHLHVR
jgi:hypothetical protein